MLGCLLGAGAVVWSSGFMRMVLAGAWGAAGVCLLGLCWLLLFVLGWGKGSDLMLISRLTAGK